MSELELMPDWMVTMLEIEEQMERDEIARLKAENEELLAKQQDIVHRCAKKQRRLGIEIHRRGTKIEMLEDENDRLREALESIACRSQSTNLLWWQEAARKALGQSIPKETVK